ncbi:hypothetical protein TEA_008212 [Camellia sinensis var. sinensis]|uniref:Peptidase C1A papain C-terminal domain-containing protein n=1 Tax=Camellia sinensis var. sinensis TaxID=542762 RepID=A0A4S4DN64_CAMSN|nr:hypothetical protein TEA_008212 [Camellia sinensis var. sinensis]
MLDTHLFCLIGLGVFDGGSCGRYKPDRIRRRSDPTIRATTGRLRQNIQRRMRWRPHGLRLRFIIRNRGIDAEDHYPCQGVDGNCNPTRKNAKVATIDGYEDVPPYDEKALKKAVAHQPLSVAIEATGRAFQLYVTVIEKAPSFFVP